ncbi:MAG: thiamine phosphate synthase [Pseudomonadota bacterium]
MDAPEQPQIYLITPPVFDLVHFPDHLAGVLDAFDVACVRLALSSRDEDQVARSADLCRQIAHDRDVAIVIADHVLLAQRLGLDGVHLSDGSRSVRAMRKDLGPDSIVGSHCQQSRHDGMNAGEAGADYVSFGPVGASALGDGSVADLDLFQWWSEVIEVPVVAEGGLTPDLIERLAPHTDFFGIGDEIWASDDPAGAMRALIALLD